MTEKEPAYRIGNKQKGKKQTKEKETSERERNKQQKRKLATARKQAKQEQ